MRIGVITFPGSLDDRDAQRAVRLAGAEPVALWHGSHDLEGVDGLRFFTSVVRRALVEA
jgi:phosphoribosylformylglycinamidine synthase